MMTMHTQGVARCTAATSEKIRKGAPAGSGLQRHDQPAPAGVPARHLPPSHSATKERDRGAILREVCGHWKAEGSAVADSTQPSWAISANLGDCANGGQAREELRRGLLGRGGAPMGAVCQSVARQPREEPANGRNGRGGSNKP